MIALENLGVKFRHVFSCDNNPDVKVVAMSNFRPGSYFEDVTTRENSAHDVGTDLYVAGFPCQPFSVQGKGDGTNDSRGLVVRSIIKYIHVCKPRTFVLENVPGLQTRHPQTFKTILDCLRLVGARCYSIKHAILDAADHGVPQHRPRLFIVGILKQWDRGTFEWPNPVGCVDLEAALDGHDGPASIASKPPPTQGVARRNLGIALKRIIATGKHPFHTNYVINVDSSKAGQLDNHVISVLPYRHDWLVDDSHLFSVWPGQLHAEQESVSDTVPGMFIRSLAHHPRPPHDTFRNVTPLCHQTFTNKFWQGLFPEGWCHDRQCYRCECP